MTWIRNLWFFLQCRRTCSLNPGARDAAASDRPEGIARRSGLLRGSVLQFSASLVPSRSYSTMPVGIRENGLLLIGRSRSKVISVSHQLTLREVDSRSAPLSSG